MNGGTRTGPPNLQGLPTLTEVIELPMAASGMVANEASGFAAEPASQADYNFGSPSLTAFPAVDEEQVVQRVLADLQRNADLMLEYRLRQTLTAALARLADAMIHEVREELLVTLRDVVALAVSQELARQRGR